METALTDDDEFNAWYDSEHIPERAAVPGFLSACRYVCRSGFPRYLAEYQGRHFDYINQPQGCGEQAGNCGAFKSVAADLVTLFLSRYMGLGASKTFINLDLVPPDTPLKPGKQQFFGANRLPGLALVQSAQGCSIDLKWREGAESGSRHLGP